MSFKIKSIFKGDTFITFHYPQPNMKQSFTMPYAINKESKLLGSGSS